MTPLLRCKKRIEREILCTSTGPSRLTLFPLFFSFSSPSPRPVLVLMISPPFLSQLPFVSHSISSDLSSLLPPSHTNIARFNPHMLTAC